MNFAYHNCIVHDLIEKDNPNVDTRQMATWLNSLDVDSLETLACKPAYGRHMLGCQHSAEERGCQHSAEERGCQHSAGTRDLRAPQRPFGPILRIVWRNHTWHSVYYILILCTLNITGLDSEFFLVLIDYRINRVKNNSLYKPNEITC